MIICRERRTVWAEISIKLQKNRYGRVTVMYKNCYETMSGTIRYVWKLIGNILCRREVPEYPYTGYGMIFQSTDTDKGLI